MSKRFVRSVILLIKVKAFIVLNVEQALEGAKELLVVTDKKEKTDDGLLVYRVLSIVSICLNILSIFSVIINAVCFVFGIVSLTEANSISLKKDVNTKAIKICSIIGIVISTTIFVFKIFILVEIIISIINGIVDTTPPITHIFSKINNSSLQDILLQIFIIH